MPGLQVPGVRRGEAESVMSRGHGTDTERPIYGSPFNGHYRPGKGETDEWYTPAWLLERLGLTFTLDPCAPAGGVPWLPIGKHFTAADDGLSQSWAGERVWLNPPYSNLTPWLRKMAGHGDGVAVLFHRTDTAWWHEVAPHATAKLEIAGRIHFARPDGTKAVHNAGGPSVLLAYGHECAEALKIAGQRGLGLAYRLGADLDGWQGALW